jgi:hypothetical protein
MDFTSTYAVHRVSIMFFFLVVDLGHASYCILWHLAQALQPYHPLPELLYSPRSIAAHLTLTLNFLFAVCQMAANISATMGGLMHALIVHEQGEEQACKLWRT